MTGKSAKNSGSMQPSLFDSPQSLPERQNGVGRSSHAPNPSAPIVPTQVTPGQEQTNPLSVSNLADLIRTALKSGFPSMWVQGEIFDYKGPHRSGHHYFGLKDAGAAIRAVMWKGSARQKFELKNGLEVLARCKVDFYPAQGSLQVVVEHMEPVGIGALQLQFEQLKRKLQAEGLFDPARKRKILPLNWRVGLCTSRTGAALQDILKVVKTRFPLTEVFLFSCSVQGAQAPREIVSAIETANRFSLSQEKPLDVLVVGRGGGSYEDLFCFNDESVARAIVGSKIPVVSAVGHEIDFTIADMVADRRAATPSHAAQEIVPEQDVWIQRLDEIQVRLEQRIRQSIRDLQQRVDFQYQRLVAQSPQSKLSQNKKVLDQRLLYLQAQMRAILERRRSRLTQMAGVLDALSPLRVFDRGFSVATDRSGKIIRSVTQLNSGDSFKLQLSDGILDAKKI